MDFLTIIPLAMEYFNQIKNRRRSSQILKAPNPVLTEEEEAYLRQITAQAETTHPKDATVTTVNQDEVQPTETVESPQKPPSTEGPQDVPLPVSPGEEFGKQLGQAGRKASMKSEEVEKAPESAKASDTPAPAKKKRWSAMFWKKSSDTKKVRARANSNTIV